MTHSIREDKSFELPTWALWFGLLGIVNFFVGSWFLLPPSEDRIVYFWPVIFYTYMLLPSLILFPIGIIMVVLWFSRFMKQSWVKAVMLFFGMSIAALCFMPALSATAVGSNSRVIGKVNQNHRIYYLVKYYDDRAPTYSFCESDAVGFSGHCQYIGWKGYDSDPQIYIDQNTNLIMVESENPSFIWINSIPPSCRNDPDKTNENYVGGCTP